MSEQSVFNRLSSCSFLKFFVLFSSVILRATADWQRAGNGQARLARSASLVAQPRRRPAPWLELAPVLLCLTRDGRRLRVLDSGTASPAASTQMPSHPSAQASLWMIAPCRPSDYLALFHLLTGVMVPCGVLTSGLVVVIVSSSKLIFCVRMAPSNDGFVACSTV